MILPRFYPIVDVGSLRTKQQQLRPFVESLVQAGTQLLQLRDKAGAPQEVLARAQEIGAILSGSECRPVMNDRVDLALLAGWNAVHVGHTDLPPAAARRVFGDAPLLVGVSTHTDEQVRLADKGTADYIAIGPVFGTQTKADAEQVVGLEGVQRARSLTRKPLVAIGGIDLGNAAAVIDAGADSVAVIGALFAGADDIQTTARAFLRLLR